MHEQSRQVYVLYKIFFNFLNVLGNGCLIGMIVFVSLLRYCQWCIWKYRI